MRFTYRVFHNSFRF